jgi:trans-aconitate 2-methyltransferase
MWNPAAYQRFAGQRARPFFELISRINASSPRCVMDLGCGPGQLTAVLADRWPDADVHGVDSSPEMIEAARSVRAQREPAGSGSLEFHICDVREFRPQRPPDVLVSNAALHWVPGHHELLARWAAELAADGWLAFQVPGSSGQPTHQIMRELAATPRWRAAIDGALLEREWDDPVSYLNLLAGAGCEVDAWETTYIHVLRGDNPVLEWLTGTALRPVLAALSPDDGAEYTAELGERLRVAYPARSYGTVFPFRRIFVVARRP